MHIISTLLVWSPLISPFGKDERVTPIDLDEGALPRAHSFPPWLTVLLPLASTCLPVHVLNLSRPWEELVPVPLLHLFMVSNPPPLPHTNALFSLAPHTAAPSALANPRRKLRAHLEESIAIEVRVAS